MSCEVGGNRPIAVGMVHQIGFAVPRVEDDNLFAEFAADAFKDAAGNWNVRRFLFSKWTLREGWDNPNVFTIAKLRSCGSETSLLQEVGRGLRLPVDENGNRVSGEDFRLNYIVDFTEADFAERLVSQINAEVVTLDVISEEKLAEVARKRGTTADDLFDELRAKGYIDRKMRYAATRKRMARPSRNGSLNRPS